MRNGILLSLATAGLLVAGCASAPAEAPAASDTITEPTAEMAAPTAEMAATESSANTSDEAMTTGTQTFTIDPAQSKVTYEVGETFIREGNRYNIAIGTTNTLAGEVTLDHSQPSNSSVGPLTVDISQFRSDSDRRDEKIREGWLESAKFPTVTFQPTSISGLTDDVQEGQTVSFQITGDTTIRDTTQPLTFDVTATLNGDTLTGQATAQFKMTDFGFQPPDIAGMLKSEDDVKITIDFVAVAQ